MHPRHLAKGAMMPLRAAEENASEHGMAPNHVTIKKGAANSALG
jgi:hypothetical protein